MDKGETALIRRGNGSALQVETAASAVAAQARAHVEAHYWLARNQPRDWDDVRTLLLKDCERPAFAEQARYHKPVGKGIEGPSIRFVEAAIRAMGNVDVAAPVVFSDEHKRIVRVTVVELERNIPYSKDVVIEKTVERQNKTGRNVIGERTNSEDKTIYIVEATDDEIANKEGALVSKAIRTLGLRLLPADILEECMDAVIATQAKKDQSDPDAARKRILDAYAALGVMPSELKIYLGHDLDKMTPAELQTLRGLYAAIRDGETTWQAALEERRAETPTTAPPKPSAPKPDKQERRSPESASIKGAPSGTTPSTPASGAGAPSASAPATSGSPSPPTGSSTAGADASPTKTPAAADPPVTSPPPAAGVATSSTPQGFPEADELVDDGETERPVHRVLVELMDAELTDERFEALFDMIEKELPKKPNPGEKISDYDVAREQWLKVDQRRRAAKKAPK